MGDRVSLWATSGCCVESIFCPSSSRTRGWSDDGALIGDTHSSPRPISARDFRWRAPKIGPAITVTHARRGIESLLGLRMRISQLTSRFKTQLYSLTLTSHRVCHSHDVLTTSSIHNGSTNCQIFPQLRHKARAFAYGDGWIACKRECASTWVR
jgi:hypothetical protein